MMKRFLTICVVDLLLTIAMNITLSAQSESYDSILQKGKASLSAGRVDDALTKAQIAIKQDQSRWEAYALAGGALVAQHRCEKPRNT